MLKKFKDEDLQDLEFIEENPEIIFQQRYSNIIEAVEPG